jgi:HK97 family phage prohead protease
MSDEHEDVMVSERVERRDWEFAEDANVAVETRADGRLVLTGYAVRYNTLSVDLGGFRETILPGAFDRVLSRQRGKQDVVALFNHDPNQLLGRTSSGTLELSSDEKGLRYTVVLPSTELGRTIAELTARGDLRGSSFAFTVDTKGESWAPGEDGKPRRSIREVTGLYDVSVVTHPAYSSSSTAIARRSMSEWLESQAEERCECQEVHAEEKAAPVSIDGKGISMRLRAALLRTFTRNCGTGSGGFGAGNSCGKGGGGGDSSKGAGKGPGGLQNPASKHDVSLPKNKSKINIDQADAALKQMGYTLGKGESKVVGKGRVMTYKVTDKTGHTATVTVDELKDLVYDNKK